MNHRRGGHGFLPLFATSKRREAARLVFQTKAHVNAPRIGVVLFAVLLAMITSACVDLATPNESAANDAPVVIPTPFAGADTPVNAADRSTVIASVTELVTELEALESTDRAVWEEQQRTKSERAVERLERTTGTDLNTLLQQEFEALVVMQSGGDDANTAAIEWLNLGQQISELRSILVEDLYSDALASYAGNEAQRAEQYAGIIADEILGDDHTPAERDELSAEFLDICRTKLRGLEPFAVRQYLRDVVNRGDSETYATFGALTAVCPQHRPQVLAVLDEQAGESDGGETSSASATGELNE